MSGFLERFREAADYPSAANARLYARISASLCVAFSGASIPTIINDIIMQPDAPMSGVKITLTAAAASLAFGTGALASIYSRMAPIIEAQEVEDRRLESLAPINP